MLLSLNWLNDYLGFEKSPQEIEDALTLIGLEVEGVTTTGLPQLEKVVVGEVKTAEPHPDADRLSVCTVDTGAEEPHQIVCGAKNFKVGDRVPVALPGAVLPGNFKIKKSKLRGVKSAGMMCSSKELNLGDDHSGLLILGQRPEIGTPINEVFTDSDTVFDLSITPNRPDCLSHIGVARDLAAYFRSDHIAPGVEISPTDPFQVSGDPLLETVEVHATENCPYYQAFSIRGVKIGPSPDWMQRRLKAVGLRPVNNVVDITNYVLMETGQPLHAFDKKKVKGDALLIRQARDGETITTLDEKKRGLDASVLVIADRERPLVVAGVMGSVDAEVDDSTTDIVLEAAYFDPVNIRRTSRKLGLSTDSSYRFERGVDPRSVRFAARRAIDLILKHAGGSMSGKPFIVGEPPMMERELTISPEFVRERIGFDVEDSAIRKVLEHLNFGIRDVNDKEGAKRWEVSIPSYRLDIDGRMDLVEEFLRIHGTDKIPASQVRGPGLHRDDAPLSVFNRTASQYLVSRGFNECYHYTTRSGEELETWFTHAAKGSLGLANPLASDQTHLRASLLPGLLDALQLNQARKNNPTRLFEVGRVFREHDGKVFELASVSFLLVQSPLPDAWMDRPKPDFFTAKSIVEGLLRIANIDRKLQHFQPILNEDSWQAGHCASSGQWLEYGWLAKVGLLNVAMLKNWDIEGTCYAGALYFLPDFFDKQRGERRFKSYSEQPPVSKDLALLVDEDAQAGTVRDDLERAAKKAAGGEFSIDEVRLFDLYEGKGLPEGKKSLAFNMLFRHPSRTLTDKEVNKVFEAVRNAIQDGTGYSVR